MLQQPLPQSRQVIRECAEYLHLALLLPFAIGKNHTGRYALRAGLAKLGRCISEEDVL